MSKLQGKVALVTGAASGIGRACAVRYAQDGARVVISDVDDEGSRETLRLVEDTGGAGIVHRADVSNAEECEALIKATVDEFGKLDIACNNAGISGERNSVGDLSVDGWRKVIAINLDGVFYCMKYEIEQMMKQNSGGAIVNMSSILGKVAFPQAAGYVAAKHAVNGLTKNAALEYSAKGIRVNAIGPGFIDTPLLSSMSDEERNMLVDLHPIGRLGKSEEIADLTAWLSSDEASFVTGAYFPADGGYLAR